MRLFLNFLLFPDIFLRIFKYFWIFSGMFKFFQNFFKKFQIFSVIFQEISNVFKHFFKKSKRFQMFSFSPEIWRLLWIAPKAPQKIIFLNYFSSLLFRSLYDGTLGIDSFTNPYELWNYSNQSIINFLSLHTIEFHAQRLINRKEDTAIDKSKMRWDVQRHNQNQIERVTAW